MKNKTPLIILIMIVVLIGVTIAVVLYMKNSYETALETPYSDSTDVVEFEIHPGESLDTIVPSLVNQDLLKKEHQNYFKFYVNQNNIAPKIQAGTFMIPQNLTIKELAETLQRAQGASVWITIPEGLRNDEIAEIVTKRLTHIKKADFIYLTQKQDFIQNLDLGIDNLENLEGFLHPDKYLFEKETDAREVIKVMVENFKTKVPYEYTYDDVILASLIEREAVNAEDRRIVSDILQKRLEEQWLLQVDATILYYKEDWSHTITVSDLEEEHVYNSYKFHGLPPQPICNPGLDAIKSVFERTETDYYYYIHDNDRNPHYSRNLEEHEAKVQKYLR